MITKKQLNDRGFIANISGKEYVLYKGLLAIAHEMGLKSISTEPIEIDWTNGRFVFCATVVIEKPGGFTQTFTEYGDSLQCNTSKLMFKSAMRMAATRAKARALRDATGIGITAMDEIPQED